ncbi:MAG: TRAM domain-containing protein, partial [Synergistaceae bacterium]|nr:TRAM domain-containing protein [Synergistaceae bacterium]
SINQALTGELIEVLADDPAPRGEGLLQGRTPSDKVVIFEGSKKLLGEFVNVKITQAEAWCLHGELIS